MGKISCLHIADVHIGHIRSNSVEDFYSTICRDLKDKNQKIDLIICTGDLIDGKSKKTKELSFKVSVFFHNLLNRINKDKLYAHKELDVTDVLFVPGNHDINRNNENKYDFYDCFLSDFYGDSKKTLYSNGNQFYSVIKIYNDEKIVFVGLNSCMGKKELSEQDSEWIEELNFDNLNLEKNKEDEIIELLKTSKTKYDDYGEISTAQLHDTFDNLKAQIGDFSPYTIVCFFHHHIYPFPEIYNKYGDSSMIRNFPNILNDLIANNIRFILHGHKHTPISRFVTTNKYFENPRKSLYVFSTGTLTNDGNRSFEVVDIFSPNEMIEAEVHKYMYSNEELLHCSDICVPPSLNENGSKAALLCDLLRQHDFSLYNWFKTEIEERDNISLKFQVDHIIEDIEKTILHFSGISQDLIQNSNIIAIILFSIRYRIIQTDSICNNSNNSKLIEYLDSQARKIISDPKYYQDIKQLLSIEKKELFNKKLKNILENTNYSSFKKETSYIAIICFFTDLHLAISQFGDIYFKREGINHKINIKLEEGQLALNVPSKSIKIIGDENRRAAFVHFKSKNPTAHKVGVLIVKDFEERITNIEDAFKELNLKIYYTRPIVEKDGYQMDNYNFEAYIPTLLPLLTGDNLYSQKEVFVRELIQNSYDAIRLRKSFDKSDFDTTIYIKIGKDNKTDRRYLQIRDNGVGMDLYKIERYFTSIGRSFYQSEDFKELQKEKKIQYKALSNFGIGFLSVFMVCTEVFVRTRSLNSQFGINIHIPNYEGCFFINKDEHIDFYGTEIRIYEDDRKLINTQNIKRFIKENFWDFCYDIEIEQPGKKTLYKAYSYRYDLSKYSLFVPILNSNRQGVEILHLPFNEISQKNINQYEFGVCIDFSKEIEKNNIIYLNAGIKVNTSVSSFIPQHASIQYRQVVENYPSSLIQLNVSRDKILAFKLNTDDVFKEIIKVLSAQAFELIDYIKCNVLNEKIAKVHEILTFAYKLNESDKSKYLKESYCMKLNYMCGKMNLKISKYSHNDIKNKEYALAITIDDNIHIGKSFETFLHEINEKIPIIETANIIKNKEYYSNEFASMYREVESVLGKGINIDLFSYVKSNLNHIIDKKIYIRKDYDVQYIEKDFRSPKELIHNQAIRMENNPNYAASYLSILLKNMYYNALNKTNIKDVSDCTDFTFL